MVRVTALSTEEKGHELDLEPYITSRVKLRAVEEGRVATAEMAGY